MKTPAARKRLEKLERICREKGLRLTMQRRLVMETLVGRLDHPTADQIHEALGERYPNLSRTSVYRILDALVKMGLATKVSHPGAAIRYDPNIDRHHHLLCESCGKVLDFQDPRLNALPLPQAEDCGFQIKDYSVFFRGLCDDCASREREAKSNEPPIRSEEENEG